LVGRPDDAAAAGVGHGGTLAQWSANLGPMVDSGASGWTKAIATAATVAVAGVGAGAMTTAKTTQRPLSPASFVSITRSGRAFAPAVSRAASATAVAGTAVTAVPPRSAAGVPTALRSNGGASAGDRDS